MQVMPFWARLIGDGDASRLFHMQTNLRFGCVILRHYLNLEHGDMFMALGRYNGSRGRARISCRRVRGAQGAGNWATGPAALTLGRRSSHGQSGGRGPPRRAAQSTRSTDVVDQLVDALWPVVERRQRREDHSAHFGHGGHVAQVSQVERRLAHHQQQAAPLLQRTSAARVSRLSATGRAPPTASVFIEQGATDHRLRRERTAGDRRADVGRAVRSGPPALRATCGRGRARGAR